MKRLAIVVPAEDAAIAGAFEHRGGLARVTGGPSVTVGPGTVWMQLALDALDVTPDKILNRTVRPLLKALTRASNTPVSYFGRDWISAAHRPVGAIAFAHDAATNSAVFEAFVAVTTPFAVGRPSFRGKEPATLNVDIARVTAAIAEAYELAPSGALAPIPAETVTWKASRDEAIGRVCAGHDERGRLRLGGELMASHEAIAALEAGATEPPAGAVLFGARLSAILEVIAEVQNCA